MELRSDPAPAAGSRVNLRVESVGLVSKLFKVEDDYVALLNDSLCVQNVHSVSQEGSRAAGNPHYFRLPPAGRPIISSATGRRTP